MSAIGPKRSLAPNRQPRQPVSKLPETLKEQGRPLWLRRVERRLAAILAAVVVGYSRLMGADEEGTHATLKACRRELIDPKIGEHRGRTVKNTGDGALVEFPSAVDAVRCAIEIQRVMAVSASTSVTSSSTRAIFMASGSTPS